MINLIIQKIKKITKLVAQAETNLIAISILQIPMLAKEAGKKELKSNEGNVRLLSKNRQRPKGNPSLKASEEGRKKFQ